VLPNYLTNSFWVLEEFRSLALELKISHSYTCFLNKRWKCDYVWIDLFQSPSTTISCYKRIQNDWEEQRISMLRLTRAIRSCLDHFLARRTAGHRDWLFLIRIMWRITYDAELNNMKATSKDHKNIPYWWQSNLCSKRVDIPGWSCCLHCNRLRNALVMKSIRYIPYLVVEKICKWCWAMIVLFHSFLKDSAPICYIWGLEGELFWNLLAISYFKRLKLCLWIRTLSF